MKKLKKFFMILLMFIVLCVFTGCGALEVFGKTELPQIKTQEELCKFVQNKLKSGEEEIKAYVSTDITEEEFIDLNQYIDGYYGKINEYSYRNSLKKGYYSVVMYAEVSDNYYAERIVLDKMQKSKASERAAKLADKAEQILEEIIQDDMTDYEKELAIHNYIVSNGEYGYIEGKEKEQSYRAYGILVKKKGVCQAYAEAIQLLLTLSGIKSKIIVGKGKENGENHAWNLVKLDDSWYQLDTTWDDPAPDREGRILYTYFNLTDDQMAKDHEWNKSGYPKANGEKYNYYKKEGICFKTQTEAKNYMKDLVSYEHATVIDFMVEDYDEDKYGKEWGSFLWDIGNIKSISYEIYGKEEKVAFRFYVEYED